jgi:hypothetical protein
MVRFNQAPHPRNPVAGCSKSNLQLGVIWSLRLRSDGRTRPKANTVSNKRRHGTRYFGSKVAWGGCCLEP